MWFLVQPKTRWCPHLPALSDPAGECTRALRQPDSALVLGLTNKTREREGVHIFEEEGGQPFKHQRELGLVCGLSPWLGQGMGKFGLEAYKRGMCVCEGGREASTPSFPWKLEEELSHKSEYTSPILH